MPRGRQNGHVVPFFRAQDVQVVLKRRLERQDEAREVLRTSSCVGGGSMVGTPRVGVWGRQGGANMLNAKESVGHRHISHITIFVATSGHGNGRCFSSAASTASFFVYLYICTDISPTTEEQGVS